MTAKRLPSISLTLLFVAYTALGWEVSGPHFPRLEGVVRRCEAPLARAQVVSPVPHLLRALPETKAPALDSSTREPETSGQVPGKDSSSDKEPKATGQLPGKQSPTSSNTPVSEFQINNLQNTHFRPTDLESFLCLLSVKYNLPIILSAVVWIVVAAIAFMNPLISFSRFIARWFQSDTVAFLAICTIAGMASMMLFWLHVFLQILTILAAETLARLDLQLSRINSIQAFWILLIVSLAGLILGLGLRFVVSY